MELLAHLVIDGFDAVGGTTARGPEFLARLVQRGLQAPFLLCQLLALSARHLSFEQPARSCYYATHALTLQTRAVSLFNSANSGTHGPDIVDMMLYSSVLSHQCLADMLRKPGDLDALAKAFTQGVHRGVYKLAIGHWSALMETELKDTLIWDAMFTNHKPQRRECEILYDMFENSSSLATEEREALLLMIEYLQIGFEALTCDEKKDRHQMIWAWPALATDIFLDMVGHKRCEAMILIAWYAVLLHHGRRMWQVGDAGARILRLTSNHLSESWKFALEYPTQVVLGQEG